jgi:hypothetical protein
VGLFGSFVGALCEHKFFFFLVGAPRRSLFILPV